jgi:hypothetical protein
VTTLEQQLRALELEWPPTPDLAAGLEQRLDRSVRARPQPVLRLLAVGVAVLVVAAGAVLALSPGARSAVLRFFHIRGATVERVDRLPELRSGGGLGLGQLVPIDVARAAVSFPIRLPAGQHPDRVLLDRTIGRGAVSLVWCCPELVLTELRGDAISYVQKQVGPGTTVEYLAVGGRPGVWVAGPAHAVVFRDEVGRVLQSPRLARNVLLGEADGVTLRLEGDLTRERALAIAATIR